MRASMQRRRVSDQDWMQALKVLDWEVSLMTAWTTTLWTIRCAKAGAQRTSTPWELDLESRESPICNGPSVIANNIQPNMKVAPSQHTDWDQVALEVLIYFQLLANSLSHSGQHSFMCTTEMYEFRLPAFSGQHRHGTAKMSM